MFGTEGFDLWWLIPIVLIGLCLLCARACCFGRRHRIEERPERNDGKERRDGMTTEREGQKDEGEEKRAGMGCCPPQMFAEMMGGWRDDVKSECGARMQEMMKSGCCRPEEK